MDKQKMDLVCQLNEIGIMICKLKDENKLNHCEKKVKGLHSYLKRKNNRSKTMRKKSKQSKQSITDTLVSDRPFLEDVDRLSIPQVDTQEPIEDVDRLSIPQVDTQEPIEDIDTQGPDTQESIEPTSSTNSYTEKPTNMFTDKNTLETRDMSNNEYISKQKPLDLNGGDPYTNRFG